MKKSLVLLRQLFTPAVVLVFAVYTVGLAYKPIMLINNPPDNHFVLLAKQFLKGQVELDPVNLPRGDVAEFFDRRDIYFGPFPSLLILPAVALVGFNFPQQILGPIFLVVAFLAAFFLAGKFKFRLGDSFWLAIFFVFSTVLLAAGVIPISAYLVQVIGAVLLILTLLEYYTKRQPLVVGLLIALAGMTRITLYLALAFFFFEFIFKRLNLKALILITIPVLLSLFILGAYNYKRFRSPFETGYRYNQTHKNYPLNVNLRYGLSSVNYLPTNLYVLFLKGPDPILEGGGGFLLKFPYFQTNPWGLAIWFTSPLFLYLLFRLKRDSLTFSTLTTSLLIALPSLTFFSIGYTQFGYRYSLDFLPFIFLLFLHSITPKLNFLTKLLITVGVIFNAVYLASMWHVYPLLGIYK